MTKILNGAFPNTNQLLPKEYELEIKTQKDKIDAIISKTNEIMVLSSRYYELF